MLTTVEAITARMLEVGDSMAMSALLTPLAEEWITLRRQLQDAKEEAE